MDQFLFISFLSIFMILISFSFLIHAQQPYIRRAISNCTINDPSTSVLGYDCNGITPSCQAYLTFRSVPPFNTPNSISTLLGSDSSQLSQLNSVPEDSTFDTNRLVLVPVNCSCSGQYYQSNTSYAAEGTYFFMANNTFEGLSTCHALQAQNNYSATQLPRGAIINVPLRCACPTQNQSDIGVRYLLSYLVRSGGSVAVISEQFNVDSGRTLTANGLSEEDFNIYPFTTLLIPLENPPSSNQTVEAPPPPPPLPPMTPAPSSGGGSSRTWIYVVVGVVGGVSLVLVIGSIIYCKRKKKTDPIIGSDTFEAQDKPLKGKLEEDSHAFLESLSSIAQSLKVYTFEDLKSATDHFSQSCWIKGSVYRGTINGDFAAIKRMNGDVSEEINLLNKINHFNLIRLSGVCFNGGHWYLIYEYSVNGPLSDWIYKNNGGDKFLNWTQRIQIALDVAMGLNYLHSYASPPCVHKDLKSSNVLLDSDFRAKITNFNLARSADGEEGQFALTKHIVGTQGYMAPEYLENGLVSTKLDVYAFGVLVMEMLTGTEIGLLYEGVNARLLEAVFNVLNEEDGKENLSNFMDPCLKGNYPAELSIFVIRLIDSCIKENPSSRPPMDEIVQSLSRILNTSISWELSISISA